MSAVGPDAVQVNTGTLVVAMVLQTIWVQLLPALAVWFTQVATGVGPVTVVGQIVAIKPGPTSGAAACVAHTAGSNGVGPVSTVGPTQVVVVKLLPAFAPDGVQVETGTLVVVIGAGQVVVVKPLPAVGPDAVQVATNTLVVLLVEQVVLT